MSSWEPIVKYVNEQYEKYLKEELHITRKRRIPDSRIHCCIYFLPATGHRSVQAGEKRLPQTYSVRVESLFTKLDVCRA